MSREEAPQTGDTLTEPLRDLTAFQGFIASLVQVEGKRLAAELVASALISLWGCPLSAVALRPEREEDDWELFGQRKDGSLDREAIQSLAGIASATVSEPDPGPSIVAGDDVPANLRAQRVAALHLFPVRTLSRQLGVLVFAARSPEPLSPERETLLTALVNHLAMALVNARLRTALRDQNLQLEETVRRRTARLEMRERAQRTLLQIARAATAHLERDRLFGGVAEAIRSAIWFDLLAVVVAPNRQDLYLWVFEAGNGASTPAPAITLPRGGRLPSWVVDEKRPFIGPKDLGSFPIVQHLPGRERMRSSCLLPLLVKQRAVGALVLLAEEENRYVPADLSSMEEIAAIVAIAVDNCMAYEEIRELKNQLTRENIYLQEEIKTQHNFEEIVGGSRELKRVFKRVELAAPADSSVLITGETGTGKELFARAIHNLSPRKNRPLIKINCAALPDSLIESELFGHEKGAFTGAANRKIGRFELAHRGTVFLDEIGDLSPELQVKLLRVLQEREFERLGGTQTIKVDVRVIAATNRDLLRGLAQDTFRTDLYYRLNVFPIHLPSLRERADDIPLLVQHFLRRYAAKMGKEIERVSRHTMRRLVDYHWPGNVRELENVIERGVILSSGPALEIEDEALSIAPPDGRAVQVRSADSAGVVVSDAEMKRRERDNILAALKQTNWRIRGAGGAAALLDLKPTTLASRIKKLGLTRHGSDKA